MSTAPSAALRLEDVSVRFGGLVAVQPVSLEIPAGERWAVIGPNGAGKTTLFRTISGEQQPTSGRIELFGRDVTRTAPHRRAHLGVGRTYQITNLFGALTVEDNVMIAAQGSARSRFVSWRPVSRHGAFVDRVDRALEQVRLTRQRKRRVSELSHGEQRQLELAMGLASDPKLLLLDEPAAGLSAAERVLMRRLIDDLPRDLTVVLIEHDMNLVLELVGWIVVLDNGALIAEGTPSDIRDDQLVQSVYLKSE